MPARPTWLTFSAVTSESTVEGASDDAKSYWTRTAPEADKAKPATEAANVLNSNCMWQ